MTTSLSYDFTTTRDSLISSAFRKIGALGDYETIDAHRLAAGVAAINPMVKALASKGMPIWAITEQYLPFTHWGTSSTVSIGPGATINQVVKPLKIKQVIRRDNRVPANPVDTEMSIYTYQEYENLPTKNVVGAPLHLFYQPLAYIGEISLWPRPDTYWTTHGQLYIRYQRPFQDFDSPTNWPDFPVEWHEALIYSLAARLAPEYGVPLNERAALRAEAKEFIEEALSFGTEEGSLFLFPDRWRK